MRRSSVTDLPLLPEEWRHPGDEYARVPLDMVHPNPWNPNVVPDHVLAALAANIERVGFNQPVLVRPHPEIDGHFQIVDGEHRWRLQKTRGETTIVVCIRDLTEAEAKAQTLAMNRLHGEMEPAMVARMMREVAEAGVDFNQLAEFTGYTLPEIEGLDKLLDFDWSQFGQPPADSGSSSGDDEWATVRVRVPELVADMFASELERLKGIRGTEHDHLALELMIVNSAQTLAEHMTGEEG